MTGPHHREHRLIAQEPDPCLGIGIHHHHVLAKAFKGCQATADVA